LLQLSQRNHHAAQYAEGDRILALRAAVEATIDADIRDAPTSELVCGRGRRRLDNLQVLMQQVQVGIRELQRLAIRSRAESDFTGAQALDAVSVELVQALSRVEKGLSGGVFSLLDSESGECEIYISCIFVFFCARRKLCPRIIFLLLFHFFASPLLNKMYFLINFPQARRPRRAGSRSTS